MNRISIRDGGRPVSSHVDAWSVLARTFPEWVVYVPLALLFALTAKLHVEGDSQALVAGATYALRCIANGTYPCTGGVGHYPPFQYVFALAALALGLEPGPTATLLVGVSLTFAVAASVLFFWAGRRTGGIAGAHLALALIFSGYAIYYFFSSFNEIAAFTLFAAFCAVLIYRGRLLHLAALAMACCTTKEIGAFLVVLVYCTALAVRGGTLDRDPVFTKRRRAEFAAVVLGVLLGVAVDAAFNQFRFGQIVNPQLSASMFVTPSSAVTAYFSYLFISPAGGLAFVWFSLAALMGTAVVLSRRNDRELLAALGAIGIVAVANLGLAFWWAPFGWYAWGPRLTLPILGAAAMLLIALGPRMIESITKGGSYRIKAVAVFAVITVSLLPNAMVLADAFAYFRQMFAPGTINEILAQQILVIEFVGREVFKLYGLESYGRVIVPSVTASLVPAHLGVAVLAVIYAALAAWRICAPRR